MKKDYMIWVTYHKDELVSRYGLKEDDHHRLFPTHNDAAKDNINVMNPVYSEMVTMWYVWKNNLKSDYVGFEHYRRHLDVRVMPEKGECQVYRTLDFNDMTLYMQYSQYHNRHDMDVMLGILNENYGEGNPYTDHITNGHVLIANCTFLMKWTDFTKMCRFLFPLLEEFGRRMGIEGASEVSLDKWREKAKKDFGGYRTDYQARVVSFIAERLISAWISTHLKIYNGVDVLIIHYNTPELTEAAICSLNKTTPGCHVYLFDNSDSKPFKSRKLSNVTVIDNTKGQLIDFDALLENYPDRWTSDTEKSNYGSMKHCKSVDYMMDELKDGFVLMDSDVLLTRNICSFVDRSVAVTGVEFGKHGVVLFQPFLCWVNVPMLQDNGIRYFNSEKMWALSNRKPDCWYDTGAWLHEEVMRHKMPWKFEDIWRYIIHFGHGSWHGTEQKVKAWLEKYRNLYE